MLNNQPSNSAVAFTDGSCSGNPRPCGSGAIIFHQEEEIELKRAVSNRDSIVLAEIIAIKIVFDYQYFINSKNQELHNLTIFSDSQSALGILTLNWKSENYFQSINEIKSQINYLKEQGVVVSFNSTPVHASVKGNEIADQLVKEAAKEAEALEVSTQVFTKQDIRKAARDAVTKKCQVRWDSSNSGRHYYRFHKVVKDKVKKDLPNKRLYTVINSLRTGYSKLNAY